jgi:ComF family protein
MFLRPALHYAYKVWQELRILPTRCALCTQIGNVDLCEACNTVYFQGQQQRCVQCGLSILGQGTLRCGACLSDPPYYDHSVVACDYQSPYEHIPLALKFGHQLALASFCADRLFQVWQTERDAKRGHDVNDTPDFFCPVPLGSQRLAERGFNQSVEIARPLASLCGSQLALDFLFRQRETKAQSQLKLAERQRNVKAAFALHPSARIQIQGKHIALVDDVMTTGSTLNEIAYLLKKNGARKITNFVFARTDHLHL